MFSQFIAPIEIEVESEALPRSLDSAARRAKLRRGGKNRAATLGMTEGGVGPGRGDAQRICHFCHPACPERSGAVAQPFLAVRLFLFCHPERSGRFFPSFAPRERRPRREGPWQHFKLNKGLSAGRISKRQIRSETLLSVVTSSLLYFLTS